MFHFFSINSNCVYVTSMRAVEHMQSYNIQLRSFAMFNLHMLDDIYNIFNIFAAIHLLLTALVITLTKARYMKILLNIIEKSECLQESLKSNCTTSFVKASNNSACIEIRLSIEWTSAIIINLLEIFWIYFLKINSMSLAPNKAKQINQLNKPWAHPSWRTQNTRIIKAYFLWIQSLVEKSYFIKCILHQIYFSFQEILQLRPKVKTVILLCSRFTSRQKLNLSCEPLLYNVVAVT